MGPSKPIFFEDRPAWRKWLEENHDKSSEVWVLTYKTHTGRKCLNYGDALDEALCYGWIDSRLRRIDDERHMWRFAPRKLDSIWSLSNRTRVERLISQERMTAHGIKKVEAAKRSGEWAKATSPSKPPRMPMGLKDALMKNEKAWKNFQAFAKSYRTTYIYWVMAAKREETRKKRIREVVDRAERNLKMYMA
jgi:uncharacterized protein YdeI (YjbR/CyaY-like superfamily)